MMLEFPGQADPAHTAVRDAILRAIEASIAGGIVTAGLDGKASAFEAGKAIAAAIEST